MPTTHVTTIPSMSRYLAYVTLGNGETYRRNVADGTVRYLAQECDLGSVDNTLSYVDAVMRRFPIRSLEGYEIRVSWSLDELDPSNPDDVRTAMAFGHELAHAVFPDCPTVITAHGDGNGGCLHLHIASLNHNMETRKAIRGDGRNHRTVAAISDRIATEEYHFRKVERHRSNEWSLRRQELEADIEKYAARESDASGKWSKAHRDAVVRLALGDAIAAALDDEDVTDLASFERVLLEKHGCELRRKDVPQKDGSVVTGFTYAMRVEVDGKTRMRRAKASAICSVFDAAHIEQTIDAVMVERHRREALEESGVRLDDVAPSPTGRELALRLVESHDLVRYEPVHDAGGAVTGVRLVPHPDLFGDDSDAASYTLSLSAVKRSLGFASNVATSSKFLRECEPLPEPSGPSAVANDFVREYVRSAERVASADAETPLSAGTFVNETLKSMVQTAKSVWTRVVAGAERLRRGRDELPHGALDLFYDKFLRRVAGPRRSGSVVEPPVVSERHERPVERVVEDDAGMDPVLRDVLERSRKARERESAEQYAKQRELDALAGQRSSARGNRSNSHEHGGLGE